MNPLFLKRKEKVCRERAQKAADEKYDNLIREKRKEYSKTKNVKLMQEIIKLSRQKTKFTSEAYRYHLENYSVASDSISDKHSDEEKKKFGLKEFSDYLTDALKSI